MLRRFIAEISHSIFRINRCMSRGERHCFKIDIVASNFRLKSPKLGRLKSESRVYFYRASNLGFKPSFAIFKFCVITGLCNFRAPCSCLKHNFFFGFHVPGYNRVLHFSGFVIRVQRSFFFF